MDTLHDVSVRSRSTLSYYYWRGMSKTSKTFGKNTRSFHYANRAEYVKARHAYDRKRDDDLRPTDDLDSQSHVESDEGLRNNQWYLGPVAREKDRGAHKQKDRVDLFEGFSVVPPDFVTDVFCDGKILEVDDLLGNTTRKFPHHKKTIEARVKLGVIIDRGRKSSKCLAISKIVQVKQAEFVRNLEQLPPPLALVFLDHASIPHSASNHVMQPLRASRLHHGPYLDPLLGILDYGQTFDIPHHIPVRTIAQITGSELEVLRRDWKRISFDESYLRYAELPVVKDSLSPLSDRLSGPWESRAPKAGNFDASSWYSWRGTANPQYLIQAQEDIRMLMEHFRGFQGTQEEERENEAVGGKQKGKERARIAQQRPTSPAPIPAPTVVLPSTILKPTPAEMQATKQLKQIEALREAQRQTESDVKKLWQRESEQYLAVRRENEAVMRFTLGLDDVQADREKTEKIKDAFEKPQAEKVTQEANEREIESKKRFEVAKKARLDAISEAREQRFEELLLEGDSNSVKAYMETYPKVLDDPRMAWIQEVIDFGCSLDEAVELLIGRVKDSPWIYFEHQENTNANFHVDWHVRSCPHTNLVAEGLDDSFFPSDTEDLSRTSSFSSNSGYSAVKNVFEGLCGLGGISPFTRHHDQWTGQATFNFDKQEASLSLNTHQSGRQQVLQNLNRVTHRLCCAASILQGSRLCCNSFTLLVLPEGSQVELVRIPFSYLLDLYKITSELMESFESSKALNIFQQLTDVGEPLARMLGIFSLSRKSTKDSMAIRDLELCSLIIQMLSVGFLSYMQAHMTPLEPFFLDREIRKVLLHGTKELGTVPGIIAEPVTLTCMHEMLQGDVLVFRSFNVEAPKTRLNLSGTLEDILDTWGPGCFLTIPGRETSGEVLGVRVKGGTIMASRDDPDLCHWFPTTFLQPSDRILKKFDRVTVGAPSGSPTTVKTSCHKKEEDFFDQYESILDQLGTHAGHWEVIQHQFTFQFSVPYVALQYGRTLGKVPTRTIKEEQLSKEKLDIGFLESFWGLQISICTGVARRVRMREVIADMLPNYVARGLEIPDPWFEAEKDEIIGAFRDEENTINLKDWLRKTKKEHRDFLLGAARGIVDLLKSTGIDSEDCLAIACIMPEETRCLRIKCEHESYWAKMLADSETCATFAYFTRKCLETDTIECSGPSTSWPSTSILSTAVSLHQKSNHARPVSSQLVLQNGEKYFIGKRHFRLQVTVEKRPTDHTRLLLSESPLWRIPDDAWRRFMQREAKRRLRERQGRTSTANPVLVLVDEPSARTPYSRSPRHLSPSPQSPTGASRPLRSPSGTIAGPSS
ncbi:hypothetical protein HDK77DRAFT_433819 [Phyllosticta capitalensis]